MAGSVTNTFVDATIIEAADLNTNFTDVLALLDGLTNDNLSGSAGITNANLDTSVEETIVCLAVFGDTIESKAVGEYVAMAPLPYDSASGTGYTVEAVEWVVYDHGSDNVNTKTFKLWFGDPTGAPTAIGDTAGFTSTISNTTAGAFSTGMGSQPITPDGTPLGNIIALELAAEAGAGWTADDIVSVTLRLSRNLRS